MHFTGFIFIFVFIKNISCPNPKSLIYNFSVENFLFTIQYSTLLINLYIWAIHYHQNKNLVCISNNASWCFLVLNGIHIYFSPTYRCESEAQDFPIETQYSTNSRQNTEGLLFGVSCLRLYSPSPS